MKLEDGGNCYSVVAAEEILETETTNTSFLNFVDTANSAAERDINITEKRSSRSPNHRHLLQPISGCSEVESITLTTTDEDMKKSRNPKKRPLIVELN